MKITVPLLVVLSAASCSNTVEVNTTGPGQVVGEGLPCRGSCRFSAGVTLAAEPDPGAEFLGWSGGCEGRELCRSRGAAVRAQFAERPRLHVRVEGQGTVRGSNGEVCSDDCAWFSEEPITLIPTAAESSFFVGFSGDCSGVTTCALQSGTVTAHFAPLQQLRVNISGDGRGTVNVGGQTCVESCVLQFEDARQSVSVVPDASSLLASLSGACDVLPCEVSLPATIDVKFERGRPLSVTVGGNGRGAVFLDGQTFCTTGECRAVLSAQQTHVLSAATASDYDSFRGLTGDGCSANVCSFGPATTPILANATFIRTLSWHATFDARGDALHVDDQGLVIAMVGQSKIEIGGSTYEVQPNAFRELGALAEFDWDGGTKWVAALNHHQFSDSNPLVWFHSLLRVPETNEVFASGWCRTGRLDGRIQCSPLETPFVLNVSDGGLSWGRSDTTYGVDSASRTVLRNLVAYDGGVAGMRATGAVFFNDVSSFGLVGRQYDGGFEPAVTIPGLAPLVSLSTNHQDCTPTDEGFRCVLSSFGALTWGDCSVPAPTNNDFVVMLDLSPQFQCIRAKRLSVYTHDVTPPTTAASDARHFFAGRTAGQLTEFAPGVVVGPNVTWIAEWGGTQVERAASSPYTRPSSNGISDSLLQTARHRNSVLVVQNFSALTPADVQYWGFTIPAPCLLLAFFSVDDLSTPTRRLGFCSNVSNPDLSASRLFISGDKLVILVTGNQLRFGDTRLSTRNSLQSHLVVLEL